jgi:hypothetical protein
MDWLSWAKDLVSWGPSHEWKAERLPPPAPSKRVAQPMKSFVQPPMQPTREAFVQPAMQPTREAFVAASPPPPADLTAADFKLYYQAASQVLPMIADNIKTTRTDRYKLLYDEYVKFNEKTLAAIRDIQEIPASYPSTATADSDGIAVGNIDTYAETSITTVNNYKSKYGPDTYTDGTTPETTDPNYNYLTNLLKFIRGEVSAYISAYHEEWEKSKYANTSKPAKIPKDTAGNNLVILNPTNSANLIAVMDGYGPLSAALLIAGNQAILNDLCKRYLELYNPNKDDCLTTEDKATAVSATYTETLSDLATLATGYTVTDTDDTNNVPTDSETLSAKQDLFREGLKTLYKTLRTRMRSVVSAYDTLWDNADGFVEDFSRKFVDAETLSENFPDKETVDTEFAASKVYSEDAHDADKDEFEEQKENYNEALSTLRDTIVDDILTPYNEFMSLYVSGLETSGDIASVTPYPFTVPAVTGNLLSAISNFESQTADLFDERYKKAKTTLSGIVTEENISTADAFLADVSTNPLKAKYNDQALQSLLGSAKTNAKSDMDGFALEYKQTDTLALLGMRNVSLNAQLVPPSGQTQTQFIDGTISTSKTNVDNSSKASQIKTEWDIYFTASTGLRAILRSEVTRLCAIRDYRNAAEAALKTYQSIMDAFGDIFTAKSYTPYSVSTYITDGPNSTLKDAFYEKTNPQLNDIIQDVENNLYGSATVQSILATIRGYCDTDIGTYDSLIESFNKVHDAYGVAIPDLVTAQRPAGFVRMTKESIPTLPILPTRPLGPSPSPNLGSCATQVIATKAYSEITGFMADIVPIRNNFQGPKGKYLQQGYVYLARSAINTAMNTYITWFNNAYKTLGADYTGVLVKDFQIQYSETLYNADIGKVPTGTAPASTVFLDATIDTPYPFAVGILPRYEMLTNMFLIRNMKYKALLAMLQYYTLYSDCTTNSILFNDSMHKTHAEGYATFMTYVSTQDMTAKFNAITTRDEYQDLIDAYGVGGTEYTKVVADAKANISDLLVKFVDTIYAKGQTRYQLYCMIKGTRPDTDRTSIRGTGGYSQYFYTETSPMTPSEQIDGVFGDKPRYNDIKAAIAFTENGITFMDYEKCIIDEKVMRYAKNNKDLL